jgi:hypothetical protein
LPNDAWLPSVSNPNQTGNFTFGNSCEDSTVSASTTAALAYGDGAGYVFDAPAGTTISGFNVQRAGNVTFGLESIPAALSAGLDVSGTGEWGGDCIAVLLNCIVGRLPAIAKGVSYSSLRVGVECSDLLSGCAAGAFVNLSAQFQAAQVELTDDTPPSIDSITGTLPGSSGPPAARTVDVVASDVGGGVSSIGLSIDGGPQTVQNAGGTCSKPYTRRAPCPPGLAKSFTVDTANYAVGAHSFVVTATDAADNVSTSAPIGFTVTGVPSGGGGGTGPSNGSPAVEQPVVHSDKSLIKTSSSKKVMVTGTLTTADGTPIAGAVLEISSLDLGTYDSKPKTIGTVTTAANGGFSVLIKPNGAKRINMLFKPNPASLGTAVSSTIVREDLELSAKGSKSKVKSSARFAISGDLDGAGEAADGTPVEIDVSIGGRWRAVGVEEANSKGRYTWNYRFLRVTHSTIFTFRTLVRRNTAWPWPTEFSSKTVKVLVTP